MQSSLQLQADIEHAHMCMYRAGRNAVQRRPRTKPEHIYVHDSFIADIYIYYIYIISTYINTYIYIKYYKNK